MEERKVLEILEEVVSREAVRKLVDVFLELKREHSRSTEKRPVLVEIKDIDTNEIVFIASVATGLSKSSLYYYMDKLIQAYKEADEVYTETGLKRLLRLAFGDDVSFAIAEVVVYY